MNRLIKQAFTLIELLVVIAIIGILSGLIVVSMSGVTTKANVAKSQVFANSLRDSLLLDLVAEWKFDGSGINDGSNADTTYTQDLFGGYNGTINGTPLVRTGSNCINGSCLDFNSVGTTDYLSTSTITLNPANGYTFSFWANVQVKATDGGMPFGDLSTQTKSYFWFYANGTGIKVTGTGEATIVGGTVANFNNGWNYWTVTYSGTTANLYRNGVIVLTNASAPSLVFGINRIGMAYSATYYYKGKLDDLRIFDAPISASQIREQYYAGLNSLLIDGQIDNKEYVSRINAIAYEH